MYVCIYGTRTYSVGIAALQDSISNPKIFRPPCSRWCMLEISLLRALGDSILRNSKFSKFLEHVWEAMKASLNESIHLSAKWRICRQVHAVVSYCTVLRWHRLNHN